MSSQQIQVVADVAALATVAAEQIVDGAQAAVAARGSFAIALSGGSTPRAVYRKLAEAPLREQMPWANTYVFWGDDRAVPLDHPDSNYRMAYETLLAHVPLPKEQIQPVLASGEDLDAAAEHYERTIRCYVPGAPPRFDLVLLGMGPDGHTASLFPYSPALSAGDALVVATPVAPLEPYVRRITFTSRLINAAATVLVLIAGADKAGRVVEVLEGPHEPERLPIQLIAPVDGDLYWMLDRPAARELSRNML